MPPRKYRLTQHGQRQRATEARFQVMPLLKHPVLQLLLCGCLGWGLWGAGQSLFKPANFPVKTVEVVGTLQYQSKHTLYQTMMPEISRGFFKLDVNVLREKILTLPWIESASIRRIWPGKLTVMLEEQHALAEWNTYGLLNQAGELFSPPTASFPSDLPKFIAPDGKETQVLQEFYKLGKILRPLALTISKIELAPRGAWCLTLDNGMVVILGTEEIESRMQRFVKGYKKALSQQAAKIAYVDLRYTRGMAVGWKTG